MTSALQAEDVLAGGGTVVTATHRLARQIRLRHDRRRAAIGDRAWPSADVLPLDAWLRRTWESSALRNGPLGRLRLLSDDESRLVWLRVLADRGQDRLDAGVIVPLVAAGWRLCQAWGIASGRLRAAADSEDSRMFARWVTSYGEVLAHREWLDTGGLLGAMAQEGPAVGDEPQIGFAGFDPWTPALESLAGRLRAGGTTVVQVEPPRRTGNLRIVAARDESDEFARACAWASRCSETGEASSVAIVMPNLEQEAGRARRTGLEILSPGWQLREPAVRPLALAVGRQLADYPIVFCALNLLQLFAADVSFEQASLLLRSSYIIGAAAERHGRARAELALRRMPLDRIRPRTLVELLGKHAGQAAGLWQQADTMASTVRTRRLPPSQWAVQFTALLAAAGWPGDRGLGSEEFQAAEAWQHLLESFAGTDEVAGLLPLRMALGFLTQQARDRPFEPESADEAIQVLSLREAEGQDFSALWVCGVTADQWPPAVRAHPLVPLALQQEAGIPEATAAGLEARSRRRFERLLASADNLVLSWPAEQEQAETLPSPLLAGLGPLEATAEAAPLHPYRQCIAASAEAELVLADPPPSLPASHRVRGGARVLAIQAVCPARAFVEFRLQGAPLEAPARPLDAAMRGKVVHTLLERLYRIETCARGLGRLDPAGLRAVFEPLITAVLADFLPAGDPYVDGLRRLERDRLWTLLLSLRDLDIDRPGFRVVTELERTASIGPLSLCFRLDRLDQLDDGGELVIDYKTGRFDPAGWKRARVTESQLPLYAVTGRHRGLAVIQLRPPAAKLRGVGDEALGVAGIKTPQAFFKKEGLDWHGVLDNWQAGLEELAGEFAAGDFRVDPADRRWAVDQFAGLTRIHEFLPSPDGDEAGEGMEE